MRSNKINYLVVGSFVLICLVGLVVLLVSWLDCIGLQTFGAWKIILRQGLLALVQ